jgi:hypothetical protein
MKIVVRSLLSHIIFIFLFSLIYFLFKEGFVNDINTKNNKIEYLDTLLLSASIESGTGFSGISPVSNTCKFIIIIQEFIMVSVYVLTLYHFTL